jgi:hypothetical protein
MTGRLASKMLTPRRQLCLIGLVLAFATTAALSAPAAQAAPYLGGGEARQALGRALHRSATYGAVTGSLGARCYRARRNVIRCYRVVFQDLDGDWWCGIAAVRETYSSYRYRWHFNLC